MIQVPALLDTVIILCDHILVFLLLNICLTKYLEWPNTCILNICVWMVLFFVTNYNNLTMILKGKENLNKIEKERKKNKQWYYTNFISNLTLTPSW